MEPYSNLSGDSGVQAYEISDDNIHVRFHSGTTYVYSYRKPGSQHVENLKLLAKSGRGLNSYIMRNCAKLYERKY